MKFARYSSYKDSGFNWIGEIPTNWGIKRVGHHIDFITGFAFKSEHFSFDSGIKLVRGDNVTEGMLRWGDKTRYWPEISNDIKQYLLCEKDILIGMDGSKVGKNHTLIQKDDLPLLLVQRVARLRTDEQLNYKYLYHLISSNLFKVWVALVKTDPAIPHISPADIKGFPLPFPSIDEQQKIANFLDHETAKIDTLIAKQEKLIELLKEKRQAVISHAVTKGLNPKAPMKDSGVEWLGEVPEHWGVAGFKRFLSSIVDYRGKTPNKVDNGKFLVTARNIKKGIIDYSLSQEFVSEEEYLDVMRRGFPEIGDVLFTTEAPLGEVAQIDKTDIALAQRIIKFRGCDGILSNTFLKLFIMSSSFQDSLKMFASGSTALGIKSERLVYLRQLVPPMEEQLEIVEFVEEASSQLDKLESKAQEAIYLMKERKVALISAAVTGKIDVRDWQEMTGQ